MNKSLPRKLNVSFIDTNITQIAILMNEETGDDSYVEKRSEEQIAEDKKKADIINGCLKEIEDGKVGDGCKKFIATGYDIFTEGYELTCKSCGLVKIGVGYKLRHLGINSLESAKALFDSGLIGFSDDVVGMRSIAFMAKVFSVISKEVQLPGIEYMITQIPDKYINWTCPKSGNSLLHCVFRSSRLLIDPTWYTKIVDMFDKKGFVTYHKKDYRDEKKKRREPDNNLLHLALLNFAGTELIDFFVGKGLGVCGNYKYFRGLGRRDYPDLIQAFVMNVGGFEESFDDRDIGKKKDYAMTIILHCVKKGYYDPKTVTNRSGQTFEYFVNKYVSKDKMPDEFAVLSALYA